MEITTEKQMQPTPIRIPPDLKQWLQSEAEKNRRSLNGEVLIRLERSQAQQKSKEIAA